MAFIKPKIPTPPPAPNPATPALTPYGADAFNQAVGLGSPSSFVGTGARGLQRRASTQRTSLIGGAR